jgi:hypothetical protein
MAMNAIQMAADLRLEAARLKEEAERLLRAADVLDPDSVKAPTLKNLDFVPGSRLTALDFRSMNQTKAAYHVLKMRGGAMDRDELFKEVRLRGARGRSVESFASVLSRAKDTFVSVGRGKWDLREHLALGPKVALEQ